MFKFYKDIISKETASKIYHSFLPLVLENMNKYTEFTTEAISGRGLGMVNFSTTTLEIEKIKKIVEKDFGNNYEFTHTYLRLYPNNSVLHPHVDRPGLDLTLSVNIHRNLSTRWPFKISKKKIPFEDMHFSTTVGNEKTAYIELAEYLQEYEEFETEPGDGVCCTRDHVHWRDFNTLSFEGDHFVQCFYHWKLK